MRNKNIFSHPGLMIVSVVLAAVIWIAIMNAQNPEITKTYNYVSVNIANASYVESKEQLCPVSDGSDTVSVTVTTTRRNQEHLTSSLITATADLTQVRDFTSPVYVPVAVSVPGVSSDHVEVSPKMLEINLEEIESSEFLINPSTGGSVPGKNYQVGKMKVKPDTVKIRGPKSIVDIIDKVYAMVDVTGLRADKNMNAELVLYDRNGDILNEKKMNSLTIGDGSAKVRVSVELYSVINDAIIEAQTFGSPADGYQVASVTTTPSKLSVVGNSDDLAAFTAAGKKITIPESAEDVDISGASSDQDILVDITHYLPEGISLASDTSNTVVVSVKILPFNSTSVELETKNIVKNHLSADLSAVFDDSKIDIRIRSADPNLDLDRIKPEDIEASVDLIDLEPGSYTLPVKVVLPEGCSLVEDVKADMTVSVVEKTKTASAQESP